jgi:hypothetical protein
VVDEYSVDFKEAWGLADNLSESVDGRKNQIPAFFNLEDLDDKDEVKKWLDTAIPVLKSQATNFTRKAVENLMFYKGVQQESQRPYYSLEDVQSFYKSNKVSLNIVHEFVELWVNRISQFSAEITVTPKNNDSSARDAAKAKELALKDFIDKHGINEKLDELARQCFTMGEAFFHVHWDYDRGDIHPQFSQIEKKYKGFNRVQTGSGDEVNIDRMPRVGDVAVDIVPALYVLYEERGWEAQDYVILQIPTNADKARSDYPDADIKGSGDITCYWMYHLPTRYLQKGRFIKYIGGEVVENTHFPLDKPLFPVIKITNIDIIGSSRGKSFVENIKSHQVLINESISSVWDNLRRSAKGKWVYPAKTVNPKHLAPTSPGVEYYGGTAPQFVAYPGIKGEAITFIQLLRENAEKQAGIHGVTQGTPPPNVRSGLQFAQLEEQQRKAVETTIRKRKTVIEDLCETVAAFMAKYYKESDGRTITIFGKDKEYLTQALKIESLRQDNLVRVKNDDLLPTGKASQMAFYSDLRNNFGNQVVPDEMMIDMLDSGRFNQYTEFAGATVETTMAQMSAIVAGEDPEPPQEYEDLVLKWKLVVGTMRKRAFLSYEPQVKEKFKDMVLTIEALIMEKQSPAMAEQVKILPGFPVYFQAPTTTYPAPAAPPQGAGVTDEELALLEEEAQGLDSVSLEDLDEGGQGSDLALEQMDAELV